MLALLILAAGESSRIGFPKALLKISDETFAECIVRKANHAGINSILLITGQDHESIIRILPTQIRCVKNENHRKGQITSLQKGIRELGDTATEVMVWPVDQPIVETETVRRVIAAYRSENRNLTIPAFQTRKGHPVLYGKQAMRAALDLKEYQTGKDLQSLFANDVTFVDTDDPGVITDIDTPEDYEKYVKGS